MSTSKMSTFTKPNSIWPFAKIMAATVAAIIAPAFSALCSGSDTLLITENSDTSLSVTWDGGNIVPTLLANDHWQFTLPVPIHLGFGGGSSLGPDGAAIPEPGAGILGPWNNVFTSTTFTAPLSSSVDVQSDDATTSGYAFTLADGVSGDAGTNASGNAIFLTFHDAGDTGTRSAPDHASTGLLALISVIIVFGMARFQVIKAV